MRNYIPKSKYIRPEVWKRIVSIIKDQKALKAELLLPLNDERKSELQRKLTAFESVWEASDEETRSLVKLRFWEKKAYRDILLPMSESTMKRIIRKFVRDLGRCLREID